MPLYIIKNNIKLMLRNKWLVAMVTLGPIIIIAVLSSAFEDMMKAYEVPDAFHVGYSIKNNEASGYIETIKQYGKEAGLSFIEFEEGNAEDILMKNDCRSYVEFTEGSYVIYQSEQYEIEGMLTEYFMDAFYKNALLSNMQAFSEEMAVKKVQLDFMPVIDSKDYYGIIEIIYFLWANFICLACVLSDEKKYGIRKKYDVSPVSGIKLYLANMAACIIVTLCEMSITIAAVTIIYKINWGSPLYTILLIFLTTVGASAFGLFLTYLFDNLAVTVVSAFIIIWIAGFFGGSFETYMYSMWPESVKALSPIYHINRALVEFSSIGSSKYLGSAVLYLLLLSASCILSGAALVRIRKGKA